MTSSWYAGHKHADTLYSLLFAYSLCGKKLFGAYIQWIVNRF